MYVKLTVFNIIKDTLIVSVIFVIDYYYDYRLVYNS